MGTCRKGRGSVCTTCARLLMRNHVNRLDFRPLDANATKTCLCHGHCTHSSSYHTSRPCTFGCEGSYTTSQPGCVLHHPSRHSFSPPDCFGADTSGAYPLLPLRFFFHSDFPCLQPTFFSYDFCWLLFISPWVVVAPVSELFLLSI